MVAPSASSEPGGRSTKAKPSAAATPGRRRTRACSSASDSVEGALAGRGTTSSRLEIRALGANVATSGTAWLAFAT